MSILKTLGIAWTAWKVATKRFGPAGGFVVAAVVVFGYLYIRPWLVERYPSLVRAIE